MPSPIPESERVIYRKAALNSVVAQLRFPAILRIDTEPPAAFQDEIRQRFPLFTEKSSPIPDVPPEVANLLQSSALTGGLRSYEFSSNDRKWSLSLSRESLSLSTGAYARWEEFRDDYFDDPIQALTKHYQPAFYSRIALRYQDVIVRSKLGLDDVPWSELLEPHIACELGHPTVAKAVKQSQHHILIDLGDSQQAQVQHFLALAQETNEECYVIDADYFINTRTQPSDAIRALNGLNSFGGRLFRSCIKKQLFDAMEPEPVT